jgi:hypothetical protein
MCGMRGADPVKTADILLTIAAFPDEQMAIDPFTIIGWKGGASCPHCGSVRVYHSSTSTLTSA